MGDEEVDEEVEDEEEHEEEDEYEDEEEEVVKVDPVTFLYLHPSQTDADSINYNTNQALYSTEPQQSPRSGISNSYDSGKSSVDSPKKASRKNEDEEDEE